jgi:hypothetical protein
MKDNNFLFPLEPALQVCGLGSPCTSDASPTYVILSSGGRIVSDPSMVFSLSSSSDEEEDLKFYDLYIHDDPIPQFLVPPNVSHLDHEDSTIVATLPPPESRKDNTQDNPPTKSEIFADSVCLTCEHLLINFNLDSSDISYPDRPYKLQQKTD